MVDRKKKSRAATRRRIAAHPPMAHATLTAVAPASAIADDASAPWHLAKLQIPQLQAMGLTGRGITIGVVDTGVEANHPSFTGRQLRALDVRGAGGDGRDFNGHGTQMVGLIVGRQGAIAPDASIVSVKAFMAGPFVMPRRSPS